MIFRSPEAKSDLLRSWNRPDRPFFAAGACHILAVAFLEAYPDAGYRPIHLRPEAGHRGSHVAVSNGRVIFDYHGYTDEETYFAHYFSKIRRFFPDWQGTVVPLNESPTGIIFCREYQHRMPDQYPHDPRSRAAFYLKRFRAPADDGRQLLHCT